MKDAVGRLVEILRRAGAHVTFDPGRNITYPCTFCGRKPETTHDLADIGSYPNGDTLTRPVCPECKQLAVVEAQHVLLNLKAIERLTIAKAMKVADGSVGKAAKLLGMGRATLYRRLGEFELEAQRG